MSSCFVHIGSNSQRGTWVHPEIAIDLAYWVNVEFRVWAVATLRKVIEQSYVDEQDKFAKVRQQLKDTRRELTDAIRDYLARHDDLSEGDRQWMYKNVTDMVYLTIFKLPAKKLAEKLGCDRNDLRTKLGEKLGWKALLQIQKVEDTATIRIDEYDEHPRTAIETIASALIVRQIKFED